MHKRYVRLALCLLLPVFILSGCGNASVFGSKTDKERTLVFSHPDVEHQEVYETLAGLYMEEHTGLTIEVQAIAPEKYMAAWVTSVSTHTIADIVAVPAGDNFQIFSDSGKLRDLSKSEILPENYDKALIPLGSRDGHTWAIPVKGSVPLVFVNNACFEQCQLVPPQTIADFVVNCSILQQSGFVPFAMSKNDNGQYDIADFMEGLMANGPRDTPLLSSGKFFDKNTALDSGFRDAVGLAFELTMSDLLVTKDASVQGHQALLEQFVKGAYAMIPGDTQDIEKLRALDGNFSFGFYPMSGSDASVAGVFKADMMLGIAKSSKVDADAEGFISYLLSAASQEQLCNKTGSIPVSDNVKLTDEALAQVQAYLAAWGETRVSLFQRISTTEKSICLEKLDLAYCGSVGDFDVFMQDWADKLKADGNKQK